MGRAGRVHALDVRPAALRMTRDSLARLREQDAAYAAGSCEATLEEHNCFVPTQRHAGKYNKVRPPQVLAAFSFGGGVRLSCSVNVTRA